MLLEIKRGGLDLCSFVKRFKIPCINVVDADKLVTETYHSVCGCSIL
jgi:hypothetical protein